MINGLVKVLVNCTEPMKYINYVVIGRGDVILANTFQVGNTQDYSFTFRASHALVPVCHLFVYYVRNDGELVGDALDIEIGGLLQNNVNNYHVSEYSF